MSGRDGRRDPRGSDHRGEAGSESLSPLQSALTVLGYHLVGRLHHSRDRVGSVLSMGDRRRFVAQRESVVDPPTGDSDAGGPVLAFRFHLRFMTGPVRPLAMRVFELLSILTTPFFAGRSGFRTKLWLFHHGTGDYVGVHAWESAEQAER